MPHGETLVTIALIDGKHVKYDQATSKEVSKLDIGDDYEFLGVGYLYSVDGILQNDKNKYSFFKKTGNQRGDMAEDKRDSLKHPMQPIETDSQGVVRFKENKIVSYLLTAGGIDMNKIAMQQFDHEEEAHFAQLIGYSVSGWGSLSYVGDESCNIADELAGKLTESEIDSSELDPIDEIVIQEKPDTIEYLTMGEAFECDDDDRPYIEGHFNDGFHVRGYTKRAILSGEMGVESVQKMLENALSDKWQVIKKAESKILTAKEMVNGNNWESLHHSSLSLNDMVRRDLQDMAAIGDKNGYARTKELREAVWDLMGEYKDDYKGIVKRVFDASHNLKPPQ